MSGDRQRLTPLLRLCSASVHACVFVCVSAFSAEHGADLITQACVKPVTNGIFLRGGKEVEIASYFKSQK